MTYTITKKKTCSKQPKFKKESRWRHLMAAFRTTTNHRPSIHNKNDPGIHLAHTRHCFFQLVPVVTFRLIPKQSTRFIRQSGWDGEGSNALPAYHRVNCQSGTFFLLKQKAKMRGVYTRQCQVQTGPGFGLCVTQPMCTVWKSDEQTNEHIRRKWSSGSTCSLRHVCTPQGGKGGGAHTNARTDDKHARMDPVHECSTNTKNLISSAMKTAVTPFGQMVHES